MGQKNSVFITGVVLAAFAFGLLIGRITPGGRDAGKGFTSEDQVLIAPQARDDRRAAVQGEVVRRPFQTLRAIDAERPAPTAAQGFQFSRLVLETNGESPRACLQFTGKLDESGQNRYNDYIRLTPSLKPVVEVAGSSLCLSGLSFDKDYTVELRPGLPGAEGEVLERAERVAVAFGDKPAFVGFAGNGVILPRLEADGLGIETVNVDKLKIRVLRVSDRSLARKKIVKGEAITEDDYFYVYGQEDGRDVGAPVFEGELEVNNTPNERATTVFSLGAALDDLKPGAYFVRVEDISTGVDENRPAQAWRWVMFTDMALTTYSSDEGIDVFARSIDNGRPLAGVELNLIAVNNDILGTATTNTEGRARFDGPTVNGDYPLNPRMIMAYGAQEDFAALDLERAPLDLSDRNIGGRAVPSKLDAYLYLDRGIYRPGEAVHLTGLIRSADGLAAEDRPLTLTIQRPNGAQAKEVRIDNLAVGGFSYTYNTPAGAPRGQWRVEAKADGVGVVGTTTFAVEDFVPQRLAVSLQLDDKTPIRIGAPREVVVDSRFLYGAPGGDLDVEAEARLRLDPNPFPAFKDYRFGPVKGGFNERLVRLPGGKTDAEGKLTFPLAFDDAPKKVGAPLRADLVVGVAEPGGRVVKDSARIPVRPEEAYVGLKLANDGGGFGQGEAAEIEAVLIDWQGKPLEQAELDWRLVEEDYWFDWYRQNGEWRWRRSYRDVLIAESRAETGASGAPARIANTLDPGSYRLSVTDPKTGAQSDIRFYVGWRSYASGAQSPDQAAFTIPETPVKPGSRARLFLNPPYDGEAIITIATDKVHLVQRLKVEKSGREIIIDTDPSWGAGFYVLASIVTERDPGDQPVPRRAMAVAHVPFDMSERTLDLAFDKPEMLRPRQKIDLPVKIDGVRRGAPVMMTVAAVDEGILRLTKFASPDPIGHFYGKRRLGVEVHDDYGRILNANLGAPARFGGDQIGGEGLTVVPTKSIALYSGLVTVGDDGKASVPVEIPDFNGELRLMAVAWSAEQVGASSAPLTVRDAAPALLSLPRFLAPGDDATATLLIDNVDGAAGDYMVTLTASGPVELEKSQNFTLKQGERRTAEFPIKALGQGIASIALNVEGPGGFKVTREYPIQVRTPYFPVTNVSTLAQGAGERFVAKAELLAPFVPGSGAVNVSFSRLRGVEPGPLLDALYRYPYGCTEQLTSGAMPLLFVDVLGGEAGRGPERAVRPRIQKAVNSLLNRQGQDGAIGLWREGDGGATPWIGAYATDFLYRAKEQGYGVPDEALERAYSALQYVARVNRWAPVSYQLRANSGAGSNDTTQFLRRRSAAYALYVLARAGRADLSDLRYFHDALLLQTPSPLARAHIASALHMMGDKARATSAFKAAEAALGFNNTGDYYQTALRDAAGVVALAAEAGRDATVERATAAFEEYMKEPNRLHTQEKAFSLLAAQALLREGGPLKILVNGVTIDGINAPTITPPYSDLEGDGVIFENISGGQVFRTVSVSGAPISSPPPLSNGFSVSKRITTLSGAAVDLTGVQQNDRLVIAIKGNARDDRLHPAIIADLLPPGFEIETILKPADGAAQSGGAGGAYRWLGKISRTKIAEARDDRFIAALDIRKESFTVAYIVRAVTPGAYLMPGVVVEDMYRPGYVGRTSAGKLTVASAQQ